MAVRVLETAWATLAVVVALVLAVAYPLISRLLMYLFHAEYLVQALAILPLAMVSLWLAIVGAVAQSGLDGCQRMASRAVLVVLGQALMVLLAFALVPQRGLTGLAWAQIGQGLFLLVGGWLLLRRSFPGIPLLPWRWHRAAFREMVGYGANVQVSNIFVLLFDPLTKALMAKYGGPSAAGYFEIANQVVLRARTLIVAANQAIVPGVAQMAEVTPTRLAKLYQENIRILVLVALPLHALLFAWSGLFSQLLLGAYQAQFVHFFQLCALAWFISIFASPAYFMNMGTGSVGLNTLAHGVMGVLNLVLGVGLGVIYGAAGVAWGYALALVVGNLLLIVVFQSRHSFSWRAMIQMEHLPLGIVCLMIACFGLAGPDWIPGGMSQFMLWGVTLFLPLLPLVAVLWLHPLRVVLWERFIEPRAGTPGS
jgi:O-antigen/teichoic acid export membrane protein